jgi:hypothetical protein
MGHANLKIGQVNRRIYGVPHLHDAQKWSHLSRDIQIIRPSAVIITHKKCACTLECVHTAVDLLPANFRKFCS